MTIEEDNQPPNTWKMVLQAVAIIAASGVLLWLVNGRGVNQISASLGPPESSAASAPPPLALRGPTCQPSQLEITGALTACADTVIEEPLVCSADAAGGVFSGLAHVQDRQHQYVVFVSVDGGYHGAGTYALTPWDKFLEAPRNGQSNVLLQQGQSGRRWRSTVGSLTINAGEKTGSVLADLYPVDKGPDASQRVRIDGPWRCSAGGGSASFTSAISP